MAVTAAPLAPSLEVACERWAGLPAIVSGPERLSYSELWERVRRLAGAYVTLGIRPGDRVVCQLPNGIDLLVTIGAAWACGAVHVGADRDLSGPELAALVERTDAAAVVYRPPPDVPDPMAALRLVRACRGRVVTVLAAGAGLPGADTTLGELLAGAPLEWTAFTRSSGRVEEVNLLLLTSGTTAKPKLVMENLSALWAKMQFFADAFGPVPEDVHLIGLPMAHAFGLKLALTALSSGGRLVLMPRFSPDDALRLIGEEEVTILPGTPTHFTLILNRLDSGRHHFPSLRWAISAAAPLPRRVAEQVYDRLGVEHMHVYGCSEGFLTLTTSREEILAGSVGRTVFGWPEGSPADGSVAVVDPDTSDRMAPGEIGEIVYGASRPVRYWGEPPVAADGWYRTGDLGRTDSEGRLYLTGRLKDVVNRGGLKVACGEVEAALLGHPGVAECAVVAVPHSVLGEAICACIVPGEDPVPELDGLRSFLSGRLARHKLPDELRVLSALPRSKVGKLDRQKLTSLVAPGAGIDGDEPTHASAATSR